MQKVFEIIKGTCNTHKHSDLVLVFVQNLERMPHMSARGALSMRINKSA